MQHSCLMVGLTDYKIILKVRDIEENEAVGGYQNQSDYQYKFVLKLHVLSREKRSVMILLLHTSFLIIRLP